MMRETGWRRLVAMSGVLLALLITREQVAAAPSDCMGLAADGMAKCTLPVISARTYSVCIANNLSTEVAAENHCSAIVGALNGDGAITSFVNCVGNWMYSTNTTYMTSIAWKADGATDSSSTWLCGSYNAVWRYGVEMHGFDRQDLYYRVFPRRDRVAECPRGYSRVGSDSEFPDYCIKPACEHCLRVGNPFTVATAEKQVFEADYQAAGSSPLEFKRSYSNIGYYRPINSAAVSTPGFGDFWRHSYDRRIYAERSLYLMATALRQDGTEVHFRQDGRDVLNQDGGGDTLSQVFINGQFAGWLYRQGNGALESYDTGGMLISTQDARGRKQTLAYSDATTPPAIAPYPGLLIQVTDDFGRSLNFTYTPEGRMHTMQTPDGGVYTYGFSDKEMLGSVTYPDGKSRTYTYNEWNSTDLFATGGGAWAISGIYDEDGVRFATYRYRDDYWNTPDSTEHGTGAEKFVRYPAGGSNVNITDPVGTTRTYAFASVNGVSRLTTQSQPAGSGCNASSSALSYDASGNVASRDDFNQTRSCYTYETARNFEASRVEGLANTTACSSVTGTGAALPAGSRKITTQWHPDWHLKTRQAQPGTLTTWIYNGQPDPFNGNAIASCAPAAAVLSDGKPIVLLCKQVEQATTDVDGGQGVSAGLQGGVANRQLTWTYNQYGQVLTTKGPRTDVNDTTTYSYYSDTTADHTVGDLRSVTDPLGGVTQHPLYNKHGQVLRIVDPNGAVTDYSYDARQRLRSTTVAGQTTTHDYYGTGLLKRITQPDGTTFIEYFYDSAHRLVAVQDNLGNRVDYTLDGVGNRTAESVRDAGGVLARQLTRAYDALGRVQQITGRE